MDDFNKLSPEGRIKLRQALTSFFNEDEVKTLCFDLGVDYESLSGDGKQGKIRELISYLQRVQRVPDLISICEEQRPEVDWRGIAGNSSILLQNTSSQEAWIRRKARKTPITTGKWTILFLAADPADASRLRLGEELREIQEKLQLAKLREQFELQQRMSIRPTDITQALLDTQPQIVHFSGHGTSTGALCFENQAGEIHPIEPDALAALFEQFAGQVNCVVLNACYSEIQAKAIAQHVDFVVGMNKAIGDKAAIAFAIGFYQALGAGRRIEEAHNLGCVQIRLQAIPEHLTPVLIKRAPSNL